LPTVNMLSAADMVKGHGVYSAYLEQVSLVREGLGEDYKIMVNQPAFCDIMHYHTINFNYYLALPLARLRGAAIGYVHFLPETIENSIKLPSLARKIFYKYVIEFYKSMDYLVTVNPYFVHLLGQYGIEEGKVTYIPNFVSEKQFHQLESQRKKEIRAKMGIPEECFVVLGVGQIQTRKGIRDFIEVAKAFPQMQFIWAGGFSFGGITAGYKELKKIVEKPPDNVKFLGIVAREEMNDIYNLADVLFLPSYQELFPMTVLEAFNCRLPIILRNLDIYPNILFDFYLKGDNIDDFKQILKRLKGDWSFYLDCCHKSAQGHYLYSKAHVLKLWKEFYDKVYLETKKRRIGNLFHEKENI